MLLQNFGEVEEQLAAIRASREAKKVALADAVFANVLTDAAEIAKGLDDADMSAVELETLLAERRAKEARAEAASKLPALHAKVEALRAEVQANNASYTKALHAFEARRSELDQKAAILKAELVEAERAAAA